MNLLNPILFQGNLRRNNFFFEGWYYKQVSFDGKHVIAIIPSISLIKDDPHAFFQINDGQRHKSYNFKFPLSDFKILSKTHLKIKIGLNYFSLNNIS